MLIRPERANSQIIPNFSMHAVRSIPHAPRPFAKAVNVAPKRIGQSVICSRHFSKFDARRSGKQCVLPGSMSFENGEENKSACSVNAELLERISPGIIAADTGGQKIPPRMKTMEAKAADQMSRPFSPRWANPPPRHLLQYLSWAWALQAPATSTTNATRCSFCGK